MKSLAIALALGLVATTGVVPNAVAQDRTMGQKVDDAAITASVKTKLAADNAKNLVHVNVDTRNGMVHLQGSVPTERDKTQAEQLAKATDGVVSVQNDLVVSGTGAASPRTR
jgi:hyperosmotically inducible protein